MGKLGLTSILTVLAMTGLMACQPIAERRANQDPIESANRKIDQGKYDEAIQDLESLRQTNGNPKIRVVLASAYAARAGLLVEKHWGFLMGFKAPRTPEFKSYGVSDSATSKSLQELYKIAVNIEMWAERIDSLPVVEGADREDVERAIAVLQNEEDRGARLYRALLGFVLVKSDLGDIHVSWSRAEKYFREVDVGNLKSIKNLAQLCRQDVQAFANDAGVITLRLQSIVEDLMVSFPSKKEELHTSLEQVRSVTQPLLTVGRGACKF